MRASEIDYTSHWSFLLSSLSLSRLLLVRDTFLRGRRRFFSFSFFALSSLSIDPTASSRSTTTTTHDRRRMNRVEPSLPPSSSPPPLPPYLSHSSILLDYSRFPESSPSFLSLLHLSPSHLRNNSSNKRAGAKG